MRSARRRPTATSDATSSARRSNGWRWRHRLRRRARRRRSRSLSASRASDQFVLSWLYRAADRHLSFYSLSLPMPTACYVVPAERRSQPRRASAAAWSAWAAAAFQPPVTSAGGSRPLSKSSARQRRGCARSAWGRWSSSCRARSRCETVMLSQPVALSAVFCLANLGSIAIADSSAGWDGAALRCAASRW